MPFDSESFLKTLTTASGVYQMYDDMGAILYVGKAKNLKNRINSYFHRSGLTVKTRSLVDKIDAIQVTVTATESEALILEQSLIKSQRPPYNILLRDDKSYPYIFISSDTYPRITFHRGAKSKKGQYFGPYPSTGAVYEGLRFLQKTFRVRQCENSVFNNRSRPCLQYQIDRCTAPCVNYISAEDYRSHIRHVEFFLRGDNDILLKELADKMDLVAQQLDYEQAAVYRDQIATLRRLQAEHGFEAGQGVIDVFAVTKKSSTVCVHVLFIRHGRTIASKSYFSQDKLQRTEEHLLTAFLPQFYLANEQRQLPHEVLLSHRLPKEEQGVLQHVLTERAARKVQLLDKVKSHRKKWLDLAATAAVQNLAAHLNTKKNILQRFAVLQEALGIDDSCNRIECFDVSHSSGELTQAACVVFNQTGPLKSDYRHFNIDNVTAGDDYAAMEQALMRRYIKLQQGEGILPDILLIDGGKGQVNQAKSVLAELAINTVYILGIAKGSTRKAGFETLVLSDGSERTLSGDSPALHLLQEIRDEAHRFAITGHQQRREKKRRTSVLEAIPGVGSKRRRELLHHFGGLQEIKKSSVEELSQVSGISKKMAKDIYSALRSE